MAANMLAAYYDKENDTKELFAGLKISKDTSFDENINKYDVIKINMQEFLSATQSMDDMLKLLQKRILADLRNKYPEFVTEENLVFVMQDVFAKTNSPFIILIDEWDCLFREYEQDRDAQKKYLDFLRFLAKRQGIYCTGIYDRNLADQEIRFAFCTEYVHGIFHDRSRKSCRVFWFYRRGSKRTL